MQASHATHLNHVPDWALLAQFDWRRVFADALGFLWRSVCCVAKPAVNRPRRPEQPVVVRQLDPDDRESPRWNHPVSIFRLPMGWIGRLSLTGCALPGNAAGRERWTDPADLLRNRERAQCVHQRGHHSG